MIEEGYGGGNGEIVKMKKFFALIFAAVMAATLFAGAAFADLPDEVPPELAALPAAERESDGLALDKALVPLEELRAIYSTIDADEKDGAIRTLTYPEFRDKYMKGIDGVVIKKMSFALSEAINVSWFTAEKKTGLGGPTSMSALFQLDSASGRYLYMGKGQTDLLID